MKISWPMSRRRLTQPERVTSRPACSGRASPQVRSRYEVFMTDRHRNGGWSRRPAAPLATDCDRVEQGLGPHDRWIPKVSRRLNSNNQRRCLAHVDEDQSHSSVGKYRDLLFAGRKEDQTRSCIDLVGAKGGHIAGQLHVNAQAGPARRRDLLSCRGFEHTDLSQPVDDILRCSGGLGGYAVTITHRRRTHDIELRLALPSVPAFRRRQDDWEAGLPRARELLAAVPRRNVRLVDGIASEPPVIAQRLGWIYVECDHRTECVELIPPAAQMLRHLAIRVPRQKGGSGRC